MKNIIILAAGPPKPNRNRHLETFDGEVLIDKVINKCRVAHTKLYVVINENNIPLQNYVASHENINIIIPKDDKIRSTFEAALSVEGDCILVCGDLVHLQDGDVEKFATCEFESAICRYKTAWGSHLRSSSGATRRADMGDCINMISEYHKKEFLSEENYTECISHFKDFHPNRGIDEYVYNDIGTHMTYTFFKNIWSCPDVNLDGTKGTVYFEHDIYKDND
jgi:GTP:adenosylcobinamide-phosphate guanylyltransferase